MLEIIQGDVIENLTQLRHIDVVVTSPPYNVGKNRSAVDRYGTYEDALPRAEYLDWMEAVGDACYKALTPQGSLFLNIGNLVTDPWLPFEVAARYRKRWVLQNNILWLKSVDDRGHYKPVRSERYLHTTYENVFHFTKTGTAKLDKLSIGIPFKDKTSIARYGGGKDLRCRGNTWWIPYETVHSTKLHPAAFPIELATRCLKLVYHPRMTVCDPFMGSATTLLAAARLGVGDAVGIDIDREYCEMARERLRREMNARTHMSTTRDPFPPPTTPYEYSHVRVVA